MSINSTLSFGASCPSGGEWHSCANSVTPFVGCCISSPCGRTGGCPDADVRPITYNTTWQDQFRDQSCAADAMFYTCAMNTVPFVGCCRINPCQANGCAPPSLTQMTITGTDFLNGGPAWRDLGSTGSPTNTPAAEESSTLTTGAIVGIAVGGGVLVLALLAGLILLLRKRKSKQRSAAKQAVHDAQSPFLGGPQSDGWPSPSMSNVSTSPDLTHHQERYSSISALTAKTGYTSPVPSSAHQSYGPTLSPPMSSPPGFAQQISLQRPYAHSLNESMTIAELPSSTIYGPGVQPVEMDAGLTPGGATAFAQKNFLAAERERASSGEVVDGR